MCPYIIWFWLLATCIMNAIAGIALLATKNPKFVKISKIAMIFAFINIIAGDIISLILAIVIMIFSKDEEYQRWAQSGK